MKPLRSLLKSPAFTVVALLTLALGIGANTAMFSVIHSVLLRPLPYPQSERIGVVFESDANQPSISVAWPNYLDYRAQMQSAEHFALARRDSISLSGVPGRAPEMLTGALVTANFFDVVGLPAKLGRVFNAEEDKVGGAPVVVISDRLWNRVCQRDPKVLGQTLNFGNQPYTVIGVMPAEMFSPRLVEAWFPLVPKSDNADWQDRGNHPGLVGWLRLKPGVTWPEAQAELARISAALEKQYPNSNHKNTARASSLLENQVGEYRQSLFILLAATGLVLLIACANLANLLAARGAAKAKEIAVRAALGASRGRLARELLTECALLAIGGTLLGVLFGYLCRDAIVALTPAGALRMRQITIDGSVLGFSALLAVATTFLFGLLPAWRASRADLQLALKSGAQAGSDSTSTRRLRNALVIGEIAVTLMLLAAATLVLQSLSLVRQLPLGFDPANLVTARISLPELAYQDRAKRLAFSDALLSQVGAIPGVDRVALASNPPFMTGWQTSFTVVGAPEPPEGQRPSAEMCVASADYFGTIRTGLLRGRAFAATDTPESPRVTIVDQAMAERFFPGTDALGRQLMFPTASDKREPHTIVGIVPRLKVYGFEEAVAALPQAYLPQSQSRTDEFVLLVRTTASVQALEPLLRRVVSGLDPTLPIAEVRPMDSYLADTWAAPRLLTSLLTAFALLALALAAVGIYGVMAYATERRTREFGVRLALGASPAQMQSLIFGTGARLLGAGVLLGLGGALLASRVLQSLLFGVSAFDPLSYLLATGLLGFAAMIACWWPARRAARVDPIVALRAE